MRSPIVAVLVSGGRRGGCYVTTAVYGSYDCPEVWTLRRFRDLALAKTNFGRFGIRAYYAVSPLLLRAIRRRVLFAAVARPMLDALVSRLRASGSAQTPYAD